MDKLKCILFLCLFLLGGTLAAKNEVEIEDDDENNLQGFINIDDDEKGMYRGSGDGGMGDDEDVKEMSDDDDLKGVNDEDDEMMSDGSGVEPDGKGDMESEDEQVDMGSAEEMDSYLTDCKRLKLQTSKMKDLPYVPKCTDDGLFEVVQCNFDYEECFCVDNYGRKIIGTSKYNPDKEMRRTMCDNQFREIDIEGPTKGKGVKSRPGEEPEETGEDEEENQEYFDQDLQNSINTMNGGVEVDTIEPDDEGGNDIGKMLEAKGDEYERSAASNALFSQPGLLAAIVGGTVVGLLCAVLLVMFIVYRMRKKDEGSYALDEPKRSPSHHQYQRASNREFYA